MSQRIPLLGEYGGGFHPTYLDPETGRTTPDKPHPGAISLEEAPWTPRPYCPTRQEEKERRRAERLQR